MTKAMETKKVSELLEMVRSGKATREVYQRTPSHTEAFAVDIINSLINTGDICNLHLARVDKGSPTFAILDGSSRLQDIQDYIEGKFGLPTSELEVYTSKNGNTLQKIVKGKQYFQDLPKETQDKILATKVDVILYEGLYDVDSRYSKFLQLNNSTSLSSCQKTKGLSSELLETVNSLLVDKKFISSFVTDRARQKDEVYSIAVLLLGNLGSVYSASYTSMLSAVKKLTVDNIDIDKVTKLIDKVETAFNNEEVTVSFNKYNVVHLINELYTLDVDKVELINIDNNLFPNMPTQGANSGKKNEERIKAIKKVVAKQLANNTKDVKGKADAKPDIKLADAKEVTLAEVVNS